MAGSGSENRHRSKTITFRVTEDEAALIAEQAARAGVSVAALARYAVLGQTPLRASRQPSIDEQLAAQLGGKLGQLSSEFRMIAKDIDADDLKPLIESIHRDHTEMRTVWLNAFGKES